MRYWEDADIEQVFEGLTFSRHVTRYADNFTYFFNPIRLNLSRQSYVQIRCMLYI